MTDTVPGLLRLESLSRSVPDWGTPATRDDLREAVTRKVEGEDVTDVRVFRRDDGSGSLIVELEEVEARLSFDEDGVVGLGEDVFAETLDPDDPWFSGSADRDAIDCPEVRAVLDREDITVKGGL